MKKMPEQSRELMLIHGNPIVRQTMDYIYPYLPHPKINEWKGIENVTRSEGQPRRQD